MSGMRIKLSVGNADRCDHWKRGWSGCEVHEFDLNSLMIHVNTQQSVNDSIL